MAGELDKPKEVEESSDLHTKDKKDNETTSKKKKRGFLSRLWNGIFGLHGDNIEKRLQHISKEESSILARMRKRSQRWRRAARHLIIFSVILEVIAVAYAIMTTRSVVLNWKLRAFRVLPMFLLPVLSSITYSGIASFIKMCDQKDQKTVEKLRAERQAKIDELKEKTNYYITQQLIQRYDTDPAAKAAAAAVLASKLGAESGLKVYLGDESELNLPSGKSNDVELVQSSGLRNRRSVPYKSHSTGSTMLQSLQEEGLQPGEEMDSEISSQSQLVVEHYSGNTKYNSGWIARIAALLVGEDPAQSYALICGNCHMHNGLARKEDYPYMTYYCPHCNALNKSKHLDGISTPNSLNKNSLTSIVEPTPVGNPPDPTEEEEAAAAGEEIISETEKAESNYVDHHISAREQITLQDTMEGAVYSTSHFGLDEQFGDGDTSRLDLDEELFLEKVTGPIMDGDILITDMEGQPSNPGIIHLKDEDQEMLTDNPERPIADDENDVTPILVVKQ